MVQTVEVAKAKAVSLRSRASLSPWPLVVVLADGFIGATALLLAFRLRMLQRIPTLSDLLFVLNPIELFSTVAWPTFEPYWFLWLVAPLIRVASLYRQRLYRFKGEFSWFDDGVGVLKAVTLGSLILIVVAFMYRGGFAFRVYSYSRGIFLLDWGLALIGHVMVHGLARAVQLGLRRRGANLIPSLIVGQGELAELCCAEMASRPQLGYRVVGIVSTTNGPHQRSDDGQTSLRQYPVIGKLEQLPKIINAYGIEQVFITDPNVSPRVLFETIMQCWQRRQTEFSLVPTLLSTWPRKTELEQIGSLPMIKLFQEPLRGPYRYLKRTTDLVVATAGLILLSPVFLLIYWLVKLDSPGPALFRQERVGMDGRVFTLYKFRTMRVDAEADAHREHMSQLINGQIAAQTDGEVLYGKIADDQRVTRVGRILRRLSLDELPQLFNVLQGDMSLVGPRPPIPYEVEHYSDWHRKRLEVKPGITGLWQVSGRNTLPFEEMVQLDIYYIENWSLWLDLKIMIQTVPAILRGETA